MDSYGTSDGTWFLPDSWPTLYGDSSSHAVDVHMLNNLEFNSTYNWMCFDLSFIEYLNKQRVDHTYCAGANIISINRAYSSSASSRFESNLSGQVSDSASETLHRCDRVLLYCVSRYLWCVWDVH